MPAPLRALPGARLILAVLAAKLLLLALLYPSRPAMVWNSDTPTYVRPAEALLAHGSFSPGPAAAPEPEVNRTPGYPALIAAVFALFGHRLVALAALNVLLSAGAALVLARIGVRLFGPRAALSTAVLYALEPGSFHYSMVVLSETPFVLLLLLGLERLLSAFEEPERARSLAAASGLSLALATLVRPSVYYLLPVAVLFVAFTLRRAAALFALPIVLLVGGWQLRNQLRAGSPVLSHVQTVNLYYIRAAAVQALADGVPLPDEQERFGWKELLFRFGYAESERDVFGDQRYATLFPETSRLSFTELSRLRLRQALAVFAAHPWLTARMEASGALCLLLSPPPILWGYQWGDFHPGPAFVSAHLAQRFGEIASILLSGHPVLFGLTVLSLVHLALLYAAFGLGLARCGIGRAPRAHAALLGTLAYLVLVHAGPEAFDDRHRVTLIPLVCLYAGAGVATLGRRAGER